MTVALIRFEYDRWKVLVAVVAGIALRVVCTLSRRGFWMDEISLLANIRRLTPIGMFGPLLSNQLAPPGFLVLGWIVRQVLGDQPLMLRMIPMTAGIIGILLFAAVARICLPRRALFPAVVMFATSNHLIYYTSEFKQYSTDVASSLALLWMGLTIGARPLTWVSAFNLALFGASIVWFSHPSIFLLASVGLVGLGRSILANDRRSVSLWLGIGLTWLASFAGVHSVASRQLHGSDQMWVFWQFAFPPMPPRSAWDATWIVRRLSYSFLNPLDFGWFFDPRLSIIPPIALALVGSVRLWKLDRQRFALLFLPVIAVLAASIGRFYPFHGRLLLFLVPIPLIAVAAGLDAVRDLRTRWRWPIYLVLATLVVVIPALAAIDQALDQKWGHNHLGDLHPADVVPDRFPL